jgi:hypothetical protein
LIGEDAEMTEKQSLRTGYLDVPRFGPFSACSLVDQEDIGPDFEGQRGRFALLSHCQFLRGQQLAKSVTKGGASHHRVLRFW